VNRRLKSGKLAAAFLALFILTAFEAFGATNVLKPFFEKVKDNGFPLAAWAFMDGTAAVDVYKAGEFTRYSFDKKGEITAGTSPARYSLVAVRLARFSAAAAAEAAAAKEKAAGEVRAVRFETGDALSMFVVAVYSSEGRFVGAHRFESVDGHWEGYEEGVGERDPLESQPGN